MLVWLGLGLTGGLFAFLSLVASASPLDTSGNGQLVDGLMAKSSDVRSRRKKRVKQQIATGRLLTGILSGLLVINTGMLVLLAILSFGYDLSNLSLILAILLGINFTLISIRYYLTKAQVVDNNIWSGWYDLASPSVLFLPVLVRLYSDFGLSNLYWLVSYLLVVIVMIFGYELRRSRVTANGLGISIILGLEALVYAAGGGFNSFSLAGALAGVLLILLSSSFFEKVLSADFRKLSLLSISLSMIANIIGIGLEVSNIMIIAGSLVLVGIYFLLLMIEEEQPLIIGSFKVMEGIFILAVLLAGWLATIGFNIDSYSLTMTIGCFWSIAWLGYNYSQHKHQYVFHLVLGSIYILIYALPIYLGIDHRLAILPIVALASIFELTNRHHYLEEQNIIRIWGNGIVAMATILVLIGMASGLSAFSYLSVISFYCLVYGVNSIRLSTKTGLYVLSQALAVLATLFLSEYYFDSVISGLLLVDIISLLIVVIALWLKLHHGQLKLSISALDMRYILIVPGVVNLVTFIMSSWLARNDWFVVGSFTLIVGIGLVISEYSLASIKAMKRLYPIGLGLFLLMLMIVPLQIGVQLDHIKLSGLGILWVLLAATMIIVSDKKLKLSQKVKKSNISIRDYYFSGRIIVHLTGMISMVLASLFLLLSSDIISVAGLLLLALLFLMLTAEEHLHYTRIASSLAFFVGIYRLLYILDVESLTAIVPILAGVAWYLMANFFEKAHAEWLRIGALLGLYFGIVFKLLLSVENRELVCGGILVTAFTLTLIEARRRGTIVGQYLAGLFLIVAGWQFLDYYDIGEFSIYSMSILFYLSSILIIYVYHYFKYKRRDGY
ncbi:hypothetical protein KA531_02775 [Candidatus Saccharibacteria bacterium]|nr:hypothetical protein [Candidatus Saccharibacteria bacterium]